MGFSSTPPVAAPWDTISSLANSVPSYQNMPRNLIAGSQSPLTSGTLTCFYLPIPSGKTVRNIGFVSGGTAAVTPVNWWLAFLTQSMQVLAVTADQGATAIPAFTKFQLPFTLPGVVPGSPTGLTFMYACMMVNAATVPTIEGGGISGLPNSTPAVTGNSTTGMTSPPMVGQVMAAINGTIPSMANMWVN